MKVQQIKINPQGEALKVNIIFSGFIVASYEYLLFEKNSNKVLQQERGNNQNPEDDNYMLPSPTESNVGRIIDIRTVFVGVDSDTKNYTIKAELFQGSVSLGVVEDSGETNSESQTSQLYIKII